MFWYFGKTSFVHLGVNFEFTCLVTFIYNFAVAVCFAVLIIKTLFFKAVQYGVLCFVSSSNHHLHGGACNGFDSVCLQHQWWRVLTDALFGSSALRLLLMEPGRQSTHRVTPWNWTLAKGRGIFNVSIITFTQTVSIIIRISLEASCLHMF